jgi:two-component system chemotaxis sensor kinase CheA
MSEDIVREFLVESNENLDSLDRELVQLEKEPTNRDRLAGIFRTIHTIKGTCGFLGFTKLESVAHVGENLLSRLRDGHLVLTPEITTALLQMVDAVRQMLQSIEAIGSEGDRQDEQLIRTLTNLYQDPGNSPSAVGVDQSNIGASPAVISQTPAAEVAVTPSAVEGIASPKTSAAGEAGQEVEKLSKAAGESVSPDTVDPASTASNARGGVNESPLLRRPPRRERRFPLACP